LPENCKTQRSTNILCYFPALGCHYTQLIQFKDDEYDVATATTLEEAKKIVAAGFEYVTEMKGIKLFRKPKRYAS